mmetsp:Transcript_15696/g.29327  ORF Transcript_15696/g.29327 Transcript_15696/m.29327 type:complete len:103 (+) Transcript_15696:274-582(+)|eukprot:CAMPEP_0182517124 /NCGR_PEP_ID=MMETSP1321-20130603/41644_1 /TAXON_ID=91990 /ORGANISM="Bolidomonas sp., Strain RCC1657" /LENGTH=102 /DNA_ID=CAMNT_0024724831 /DNA_START=177 /DNA_END=485 /DNA_ORIENTATION=+
MGGGLVLVVGVVAEGVLLGVVVGADGVAVACLVADADADVAIAYVDEALEFVLSLNFVLLAGMFNFVINSIMESGVMAMGWSFSWQFFFINSPADGLGVFMV